jgi:signal peptidase
LMKRKSSAMHRAGKLVTAIAFIFVAAISVKASSHLVQYGFSSPFVVVEGTSMLPTLYNGDIVLIHKPPPDQIRVGDIIVYRSLKGNLVIHRVVKINKMPDCNPVCFVTKGDNNYQPDNMLGLQPREGVSYDQIIGVVVSLHMKMNGKTYAAPIRIPYLGLITLYIRG